MDARNWTGTRRRWFGRAAVIFMVGASSLACSVGTTTPAAPTAPPVSAPPVSSPSASGTPGVPSSPVASATTANATVGSLPAGQWTSIHWTEVPAGSLSLPNPTSTSAKSDGNAWIVVGWSRGWVAFRASAAPDAQPTVVPIDTASSADGLRWTVGAQIKWDGRGVTDMRVVEGPAGLLAYDYEPTVCGSVANEDFLVATSSDGIAWKPIPPAALPGSIQNINGGSAGYIATGQNGVWTSTDGLSWRKAALTGKAFDGLDEIQDGVSFSGGYVISGETFGPSREGCGGGPTLLTPSLWWSHDGTTWTRDAVTGTVPGSEASMDVRRLDDGLLLATETNPGGSTASWASADGRSWKKTPPLALALGVARFISNGRWTLIVASRADGSDAIYAFRADMTVSELTQTGDLPDPNHVVGWTDSFGSTGLLRMDDQGNTYIGVPLAN